MSKRKGGLRRRTRGKYSRPQNMKGKISLRNYFAEYAAGDKVLLQSDSITREGHFHPRFMGKVGFVQKKRGVCYEVKIKDFTKEKTLIVHPVHLKRYQ
ncbi:MAG: 50S ribosomal protein L21e [archaeon]